MVNIIGGGNPAMEDMNNQLQSLFDNLSANRQSSKKMKVAEAL